MLKLSKLNKMFLISGMLLVFSGFMLAGEARALTEKDCREMTNETEKTICRAKLKCTGYNKAKCEQKADCLRQGSQTKRELCERKIDCNGDKVCVAEIACDEAYYGTVAQNSSMATDARKNCLAKAKCANKTGQEKQNCEILAVGNKDSTEAQEVRDQNTAKNQTKANEACARYPDGSKARQECEAAASALGVSAEYAGEVERTYYTSDNKGGTTTSTMTYGGEQTSNSTGWYAARDAKDNAQKGYQQAQKDYNTCVATKSAEDPTCISLAQTLASKKNELSEATKKYDQAQKDASEAQRKANIAQEKAEKQATKEYNKAEKDYNKAKKDYDNCIAKNPTTPEKCADKKGKLETATQNYQDKKDTYNTITGKNNEPNKDPNEKSELDNLKNQLANSRNSDGVDEDAQLQAFNKLKNYAATKQAEAKAAQDKCNSYSGMTSQAAQAKAQQACAEADRLQKEATAANEAVQTEYKESRLASSKQALSAASEACAQGNQKACQKEAVLKAENAALEAYNSAATPEARQAAIDAAAAKAQAAEEAATRACAQDHTSPECLAAQQAAETAQAAVTAMRKADNEMLEIAEAAENYSSGPSSAEQVSSARKRLAVGNTLKDISASRNITVSPGSSGNNTLSGYKSDYFSYNSSGDVLGTITRRAALAIVSLKPIVYIFAGFGLIAFAWMAIFNKISWKWFGNIAMGLFLVANMGRLIEYFVAGGSSHYYIGSWNDGVKGDKTNQLANAFKDAYWVYGDTTNQTDVGLRMWKIGADGQLQEYSREELLAGESKDGFKASAAGFCKGTSSSGWANFKSCVGDIVSTAKKAANTVKTVKAAAEDVVARVETVKDTVQNVAQAAKAIGQGGSITDIVSNVGVMLNNVNTAVSTTTGAVGSLTNAASTISNNIQDIGKSQAQQAELAERRASGEATNKFDAMLKGQEWDDMKGGVENVDGEWAGKENALTAIQKMSDTIASKTNSMNGLVQNGVQQTGAIINAVENTSLKQVLGVGSNKTINDKRREKQEAAARAEYAASNEGINDAYREQVAQTDTLYNQIHTQQNEVKQLQQQKQNAQAKVSQNCSGASDTSPLCQAAKASLSATEAALDAKQEELTDSEVRFNNAKADLDKKYNAALNSNLNKATDDYNKTNQEADEICKKNPSSKECVAARNKVVEAANRVSKYTSESELNTGDSRYETREESEQRRQREAEQLSQKLAGSQEEQEIKRQEERLKYEKEQEDIRLKNEEAAAKQEYAKAMDQANNLYTQMNAQEREAENLSRQAKAKAEEAAKACSGNPNGAVCTTAQTAANAAKAAADNKKKEANKTKTEYNTAKSQAETAYKQSVNAGAAQAQRDYDAAQQKIKEAQKEINDAKLKLPEAETAVTQAKNGYNTSKEQAQAAYDAYEEARKAGKSQAEQDKLMDAYKNAVKVSNEARKEYEAKTSEYDKLKQKQKTAEKEYNDAYTKSKTAGEKLASYTNENVNKTGESRLNSNEDIDNQALINQYKSETNPSAVAQASKNSYIEHKNKTDAAKQKVQEKKAVAANAKAAYEAAQKKASESGSEADRRVAERLKNNYLLAANEVEAAENAYSQALKSSSQYEADYINKSIEAEKYKQSTYQAQMKQASADINKYERSATQARKQADSALTTYMQAKGSATETKIAQLYDEYKKLKESYEGYVKNLNQAKTQYTTAQSNYQESVAELARLNKMKTN